MSDGFFKFALSDVCVEEKTPQLVVDNGLFFLRPPHSLDPRVFFQNKTCLCVRACVRACVHARACKRIYVDAIYNKMKQSVPNIQETAIIL